MIQLQYRRVFRVIFLLIFLASPVAWADGPSKRNEATLQGFHGSAAVDEEPAELNAEQQEIQQAAVAKPVSGESVRVYGWREYIKLQGVPEKVTAKLDTGARTSSIHAVKRELFERDGKKWVRFVFTDPTVKNSPRVKIEAPLVRVTLIKRPGGKSTAREVVKLGFQIGERKFRAEFTLSNRTNMLAPVLIGRTLLKDLGLVDPRRVYIADQKIFR